MRKCMFDGCENEARTATAEYCNGHYRQKWAGEPLRSLQIQHHGLSEFDRFMKRVDKDSSDCWLWMGSRHKDWHGQWRNTAGNIELAHRAAWRLMRCEIPKGMFVLHRCDNPICVNPAHLFLGTQSDNLKDMWAKGRARPKVHYGEQHGMSKLTSEAVLEIRSSDFSNKELAEKFAVSSTTICDVRKRRIWKHIN